MLTLVKHLLILFVLKTSVINCGRNRGRQGMIYIWQFPFDNIHIRSDKSDATVGENLAVVKVGIRWLSPNDTNNIAAQAVSVTKRFYSLKYELGLFVGKAPILPSDVQLVTAIINQKNSSQNQLIRLCNGTSNLISIILINENESIQSVEDWEQYVRDIFGSPFPSNVFRQFNKQKQLHQRIVQIEQTSNQSVVSKSNKSNSVSGGITEFAFTSLNFIRRLQQVWTNRYAQNPSNSPWFTINEFMQTIRNLRDNNNGYQIISQAGISISILELSPVSIPTIDIRVVMLESVSIHVDNQIENKFVSILSNRGVNTVSNVNAVNKPQKVAMISPQHNENDFTAYRKATQMQDHANTRKQLFF